MSATTTFDQLQLDPPGPGSWILDNVHVPRPWTRFQTEIHSPNLAAGFRESLRRYGLLIDTVGEVLKLPPNEMLFCGFAIGYGDRKHKANDFRSPRAGLHEFCKFYGFD